MITNPEFARNPMIYWIKSVFKLALKYMLIVNTYLDSQLVLGSTRFSSATGCRFGTQCAAVTKGRH